MKKNPRTPNAHEFVYGGEVKGRTAVRRSTQTTYRRADPDNPVMANVVPNFVYDFSEQRKTVPAGLVRGLGSGNHPLRSTNMNSKPAICLPGITVGSGQDDKGASIND